MRKKRFHILVCLTVLVGVLARCSSYDDSGIKEQINELDARVTALENLVSQINSNINAFLTALEALENNDYIKSVTEMEDGSGYIITFSKSGQVYVYNGTDGETPVVGVVYEDGTYYWTVNGEYLLDSNGDKISVTSLTPQIRVEDGNFELSYDGENWTVIGSAGSAGLISDIQEDDESVTFVLSDGSTIVISKVQTFALNISQSSYSISAGGIITVSYTVTSADDGTVVSGFGTNGFSATFTASSTSEGSIAITAPDPLVDGEVFVFAINSNGTVSGKVLSFYEGILTVDDSAVTTVAAEGGSVAVDVTSNQDYTVSIPSDATSWLSYDIATKAEVRYEVITFTAAENTSTTARSATVGIYDEYGILSKSVTIAQLGATAEADGYRGNIDDWVRDDDAITL